MDFCIGSTKWIFTSDPTAENPMDWVFVMDATAENPKPDILVWVTTSYIVLPFCWKADTQVIPYG